jgi:hypothetical protein
VDETGQIKIPLTGGDVTEGVVRVGDTVRRPVGPHWAYALIDFDLAKPATRADEMFTAP